MTKHGFLLLEVMIALLIASLLSMSLFSLLNQINKSVQIVDTMVDVHTRMMVATEQFERDISGTCLPAPEKKSTSVVVSDKEKKPAPRKFFYATSTASDNNLELLTFITNNPLLWDWQESGGTPRRRLVRVTYRMEPEQKVPKGVSSYRLVRQEATELDYAKVVSVEPPPVRFFELAEKVKSCTVSFVGDPTALPELSITQKAVGALPPKEKEQFTWDSDEMESAQHAPSADPRKPTPLVPLLVVIRLSLWNATYTKAYDTMLVAPIFAVSDQGQAREQQAILQGQGLDMSRTPTTGKTP